MAPFLAGFPGDPRRAKFLGMPVDFILFEDDAVVFLEVKSGQASLSKKQQLIKKLVEEKKVIWKEYRVDGLPKPLVAPVVNDNEVTI